MIVKNGYSRVQASQYACPIYALSGRACTDIRTGHFRWIQHTHSKEKERSEGTHDQLNWCDMIAKMCECIFKKRVCFGLC